MNNLFDFDEIRNLTIGTVESVSPTEIKVMLETNAPQNVAINVIKQLENRQSIRTLTFLGKLNAIMNF